MEIVINRCFGRFGLSKEAYAEIGIEWDGYGHLDNDSLGIKSSNHKKYRTHPALIQAVKKLGENANGPYAKLEVVDVPDDVDWLINDYDGIEEVAEQHRTWS